MVNCKQKTKCTHTDLGRRKASLAAAAGLKINDKYMYLVLRGPCSIYYLIISNKGTYSNKPSPCREGKVEGVGVGLEPRKLSYHRKLSSRYEIATIWDRLRTRMLRSHKSNCNMSPLRAKVMVKGQDENFDMQQ